MNKDNTLLIIFTILNAGIFYLGTKIATWLLNFVLLWKTNFVIQTLWGILILILIAFPVIISRILQVFVMKSLEAKKYYFKINSYPLYIIFAFSIFQPQQNIGLIIMSFIYIVALQFSTAFAESNLKNNIDNTKINEPKEVNDENYDKSDKLNHKVLKPYIVAAYRNYLQNKFENTIGYCDKVLQDDNSNIQALILRANSLSNLDYKIEAIEDYQKIINNTDDNSIFYALLGLAYHDIGEVEKGTTFIKIAIEKGHNQYVGYLKMIETMPDIINEKNKPVKIKIRDKIKYSVHEPLGIIEEINKLEIFLNKELENNPDNILYKSTLNKIKSNDDFLKVISEISKK